MDAKGELKDNPPSSYSSSDTWTLWRLANGNFTGPESDANYGFGLFNDTFDGLCDFAGVTYEVPDDIIIPDPTPEPDPVPEPEPDDELPFLIDVSSAGQGYIDWDLISAFKSPNIVGVANRAGISWAYIDPYFKRNHAECKRIGKPRAAYHVIYPGESAEAQISHFLNIVGDDEPEIGYVLDLELDHGLSVYTIRATVHRCLTYFEEMKGKKPIIYSRAQWIDDYITGQGNIPPLWLRYYKLWLAQYLRSGTEEHPGPPTLPRGTNREQVLLHQTGELLNPITGMLGKELDHNRWQGTLESFYEFINVTPDVVTYPPTDVMVKALWDYHPDLRKDFFNSQD